MNFQCNEASEEVAAAGNDTAPASGASETESGGDDTAAASGGDTAEPAPAAGNDTAAPAAGGDSSAAASGPAAAAAPTTPATTTIAPLDRPCICLGDADLVNNLTVNMKVLKVCRDNAPSRISADGRFRIAERFRCGTRTPENPRWTWDSVCNCTDKQGPASVASKGQPLH